MASMKFDLKNQVRLPYKIEIRLGCSLLIGVADESDATADFTIDGVEYTKTGTDTVSATGHTSGFSVEQLTIPSKINSDQYTVTAIGGYAFYECDTVRAVQIPSTVISIGKYAFKKCENLTTVTFGSNSGLTSIGQEAFSECSNLDSIDLNNTNSLSTIGKQAFVGCKLQSVTIGAEVTAISDSTFYECKELTTVTFGRDSKLASIGDYAFNGCKKLASIIIPDKVTSIGDSAFKDCTALENLTIGKKVNQINVNAFLNCGNISVKILCPISDSMFVSYSCFTDVTIGSEIESIGSNAFDGSSITSITLEDNSKLKVIGERAFKDCGSLSSIDLQEATGLTTIGLLAFYDCKELVSINGLGSVKSIGQYAFYNCEKLSSVDISAATSIGILAFYNCSSLTSITIPGSVETIDQEAFESCTSLGDVTIERGVKYIRYAAFIDCPLKHISFPSTLENIGIEAFKNLTFYDSDGVTQLDGVEKLRGFTFEGTNGETLKKTGSPAYVVTYNSNGGSISPASETVESGNSVTLPDPGIKAGYSFAGWYTSSSGGSKVGGSGDSYEPTATITLYAHWTTGETYTVKFVNYDGTVLETHTDLVSGDTVTYGGNIPTRPDDGQYTYTFKGWDPEITVVTGDATYAATYDAVSIGDTGSIKGLDANGQFLLVTFASIISLTALALIITRKRP